ncbi:MAG: addiction module toxin RelE [Albidovulum sp.]
MHTLIESPLFSKLWPEYWSEEERGKFAAFLAEHPHAGDAIPGTGGVRKIRWTRQGVGKRGGIRVLYVNHLDEGVILLLTLYAKALQEKAPAHMIRRLKEALDG